jgi:hypothetical protein
MGTPFAKGADMKNGIISRLICLAAVVLTCFASTVALGNTDQVDTCHVYLVDVEKAKAGFEAYRAGADPSALSAAQKVFPEFFPKIGEEELTTKTYPFPGSKLTITASVYYTDESMRSAEGSDSMLVGVVVSPEPQRDAIQAVDNAVMEVTLGLHRQTVRTKKYLRVNGKLYLVGVECSSEPPKSK